MEEDPCTVEIKILEAQRLPQATQQISLITKTSPLEGTMSSHHLGLLLIVNLKIDL
jgi:hypothetical protein